MKNGMFVRQSEIGRVEDIPAPSVIYDVRIVGSECLRLDNDRGFL